MLAAAQQELERLARRYVWWQTPAETLGRRTHFLCQLPEPQHRLWPEFAEIPRRFVMYGGTAIALRLAHRPFVDFDFFSPTRSVPSERQRLIAEAGSDVAIAELPRIAARID